MGTLRTPRWLLILLFFGVLAPSLGMAEDKVSDGVFTANNFLFWHHQAMPTLALT